jgi:uncharacterized protein (DUF1810 family)
MSDPFRLNRFEAAQEQGGTYASAISELRSGRKVSHWMWFVFPQAAGLGRSSMSRTYAIMSLAEAEAYLQHPVLGPRLVECTRALAGLRGLSAEEVLGATDAMKLRSSMTLFARVASEGSPFRDVLDLYFGGLGDPATEQLESLES